MTIAIRRAEPADYAAVHQIFSGPKAVAGTLQLPYPSVELWRKRLAEPPDGQFSLVASIDEQVVGYLGLHTFPNHPRRRHVGQLGMAVRDDVQGQGAGTALLHAALELADRWLNLQRIELEVYVDNEPALHLYQKSGFVIEGAMSRFAYRDGQYVDVYLMARFKPE